MKAVQKLVLWLVSYRHFVELSPKDLNELLFEFISYFE